MAEAYLSEKNNYAYLCLKGQTHTSKHISDIAHFTFAVMDFIKQLSCPNRIMHPVLTFIPDIFRHFSMSTNLQHFNL